MGFLRHHAAFIICAVAAAGGIALGALGLKGMPQVTTEMEDRAKVYQELQSLASNPVNQERIDVEQKRINEIKADVDRVMARAAEVDHYEQLVEGFFPDMPYDKEDDFQDRYRQELRKLRDMLNPYPKGHDSWVPPSPAGEDDFEFWSDWIVKEREEATREFRGLDGSAGVAPILDLGPAYSDGMVLTKDGARVDNVARAHMARAQSIYCYLTDFEDADERSKEFTSSLEVQPTVLPAKTVDRPFPESLWRAQLGLWIQGDVVQAIARLNNEAAEQYRKSLEDTEGRRTPPWVGIMPVKEVVSIRLSNDYVTSESEPAIGYEASVGEKEFATPALPGGSWETVFTGTVGTEWYDVMQFSVKLVMDQRDILKLVDEITRNRFHTLLRVSYEAVPVNRRMRGKIYGDDPTVLVIMDFETIMLADPYRCWMPPSVRDALGVECPREPEAETEEEPG
jgi:hypothetical protein